MTAPKPALNPPTGPITPPRRPRLLDAFCGEGGAGMGYRRAGFDVVGIDLNAKALRRYPFPSVRADAVWFVREHGHEFDAIHLSPPCKVHTRLQVIHGNRAGHADLIPAARAAAESTGRPWVMENVEGAPLRYPLMLCGAALGLGAVCRDGVRRHLRRHRLFESDLPLMGPGCACPASRPVGVYGHGGHGPLESTRGYQADKAEASEALGIDWMSRDGLSQAIPPAYTEHIGSMLIDHLRAVRACESEAVPPPDLRALRGAS
jgi:DNA (cytosine-5)-methyltransferase 1